MRLLATSIPEDAPRTPVVPDLGVEESLAVNDKCPADLVATEMVHELNGTTAPDFARTVDIHRKPGYDPVELFLNPKIKYPKLKLAWKLALKTLRIRSVFDVIPVDEESIDRLSSRNSRYRYIVTFASVPDYDAPARGTPAGG